jgi:hypothetical protein
MMDVDIAGVAELMPALPRAGEEASVLTIKNNF